jgi:hypothetical protein
MDTPGQAGADREPRFAMAPSLVARMRVASTPAVAPTAASIEVGMPALAPPPRAVSPEAAQAPAAVATAVGAARSTAVPAARPGTDSKRPYHLGVALGLSAGIYAGSLAAVSMLQFEHDRDLIADRAPVRDAIELLGRNHDAMAASLDRAGAAYEGASARYAELATGLEALHADVVGLSDKLVTINKLAAIDASGLGGAVRRGGSRLPTVARSISKSRSTSAPPASNATTGSSGAP